MPRVNAQLERLMGSNVVHLTDRKYMTELRRRITEDFHSILMKRINQRKVCCNLDQFFYSIFNGRNQLCGRSYCIDNRRITSK